MSMEYFHRKILYDREQVTVSAASIGGTTSKIDGVSSGAATNIEQPAVGAPTDFRLRASAAVVEVVSGDVYYTLDASTPSATNGNKLANGAVLNVAGYQKVKNLRMVRQGGSDATVDISYYKG